ncbi:MAG: isochorismatase family cysteine hydrolase [Patescibacteria group bacterium]
MENSKLYSKMNKGNTALIVIDIVNSCSHEKCETPEWDITFSKIREMIPRLNNFIGNFRTKVGGEVIFVNITPWNEENLRENIKELYTDPWARYYSDDTTGFDEEFNGIKPEKDDLIITKNTYDAFSETELEKKLKEKGIQYLVVAGIFTEGCVLSTITVGFSKGFNFVMLRDLIETVDSEERQRISTDIKNRIFPSLYGKSITSEEFLESWKKNNSTS